VEFNHDEILKTEFLGQEKPVNFIDPVVSICVLTYKHRDYIKDCLDGVLAQKTTFPVEILIGDDNSQDGTREICEDYARKHSDKIRLFNRTPEQKIEVGGKKSWHFNLAALIYSSKGKYIAWCDGDDFWTHPDKLQIQFDFLEAHPDIALAHHHFDKLFPDRKRFGTAVRPPERYNTQRVIEKFQIRMSTMMFRNIFRDHKLPDWFFKNQLGDSPLSIFLSLYGDIYYLHENMTVYRDSSAGSFLKETQSQRHLLSANMYTFFLEDPLFYKHQDALRRRVLVYLRRHLLDNSDESSEVKTQLMRYKQVFKALKGKTLEDYKEHFKFYIKRRLR
jgi:glycosyltransferase involved in cell wall biosynthesis